MVTTALTQAVARKDGGCTLAKFLLAVLNHLLLDINYGKKFWDGVATRASKEETYEL